MKTTYEKDCQTHQTGTDEIEMTSLQALGHLQSQNETHGTNPDRQLMIFREYRTGMKRLNKIFEAQQNELANYPDDLPTSFANVEMELAKCIEGCLPDASLQNQNISQFLSLLRDYRVVTPVLGQNPTISLDRFHSLLQDNFQDSFLLNLIGLLIGDKNNTFSKVITFS